MITTPSKRVKGCLDRSVSDDRNDFSGEESAMFSKLDEWLSLLSERKVSRCNIGLSHILNYLISKRSGLDSELIQMVLPGYIETLCSGCVKCIQSNCFVPNGLNTKKSVELASLLCMHMGPGDAGDIFYRQIERCMLKRIRFVCVNNESTSCTMEDEDSVVLYLQGLSLSIVALGCTTVSCKKRTDFLNLCEKLVDATTIEEVSVDVKIKMEEKVRKGKCSSPLESMDNEVEWTLSSDDENTSVDGLEVAAGESDTVGNVQLECCTSLRMKAAALDAWCILTYQQQNLEQFRADSIAADEDSFDRAKSMFSCCVQSVLLIECVPETAPVSHSAHICNDGRLLVLRSACRTIGYLLELGRNYYIQSGGVLGMYDADDIKQLQAFLFDYTREEKKKSAKGSRKAKPLLADAIQLQEWLSITSKEKEPGLKLRSPVLPKFTNLHLNDIDSIPINSYAMSTLVDMLRAIFKEELSGALELFPTLRQVLGLSPLKGGSNLKSKWDNDNDNPAVRCVVEKCSPLDKRRTANRRMDRMAKMQEMDTSNEY